MSDYRIVFTKVGANKANAAVGELVLFNGAKAILASHVFSGGIPGKVPIPDGSYTVRLDIRGIVSAKDVSIDKDADGEDEASLKPFYGIQKIPAEVKVNSDSWNMREEWGSIRARLNPPKRRCPRRIRVTTCTGRNTMLNIRTVAFVRRPNRSSNFFGTLMQTRILIFR
jgi:hypothetical protein